MLAAGAATAGEADVVAATLERTGERVFRIEATIRHADHGSDHYADAFEVVAPDGSVLGERTLLHPHVNEQPFTRSLDGVEIPAGIEQVIVRARDGMHGAGGRSVQRRVPR